MQFGFLSPYQGSRLLGFESLSNQLFIQCPFVHLIMQILTLFVSAPVLQRTGSGASTICGKVPFQIKEGAAKQLVS